MFGELVVSFTFVATGGAAHEKFGENVADFGAGAFLDFPVQGTLHFGRKGQRGFVVAFAIPAGATDGAAFDFSAVGVRA